MHPEERAAAAARFELCRARTMRKMRKNNYTDAPNARALLGMLP
jgi:hypothetical protein